MSKKYEPPRESNKDLLDKGMRGIAGLVPMGAALVQFVQSPLEERRQHWMD